MRLFPNGPVLDLNPAHGKVTRISGRKHGGRGLCRRGDQAVRLRQRDPLRRKLAPPFTRLPAFRSADPHHAEAIEELLDRCGFRRAQPPDDFLDVDRGCA